MLLKLMTFAKYKFVAATVVAAVAVLQPYRPMVFVGASMSPTYQNLDWAITVPRTKPLQRGDVVVVDIGNETIVKRVAFLPGDRIPQIHIGNRWMDLVEVKAFKHTIEKNRSEFRFRVVPEDQVYLLGDNRIGSIDSRTFGSVSLDQVRRVIVNPLPRVLAQGERDSNPNFMAAIH